MTTRTRPANSLRLLARLVAALDARQRAFVFVSNGLVPAAIEFGMNFGVTYALASQNGAILRPGILGLPYLALATAILMAIGRSASPVFDGTTSWAPEASAAVGAFLLKLISGPLIALLALVRTAWWIRDDAGTSSVEQLPEYSATDLEIGGATAERWL
ncbi:hypothetical protein HK405_000123 [Cladochytrium tenue]|nr:hypothetical protein HK405_000123 [Cladochytrium tenue]